MINHGQATRTSFLGPAVLATRGQPTEMKFINMLGESSATNVLAYKYSTDQTLHWADPLHNEENMWNHMSMPPAPGSGGAENYNGPIQAVVHLHGGEVPPQLDGGPDAWMTSDGQYIFIDGSNARSYEMALTDPVSKNPGPPLWVIGTDGGYLDAPAKIDPVAPKPLPTQLPIMPGERYRVIVDFKGYEAGVIGPNGIAYSGKLTLKNTAKTPYPGGDPSVKNTTDRLMQFRVAGGPVTDTGYNPASGAPLRTPMVRLANPATGTPAAGVTIHKFRQLSLNDVMGMPVNATDPVTGLPVAYPGGPLEILVNNTKWHGERIADVDGMGMICLPSRDRAFLLGRSARSLFHI